MKKQQYVYVAKKQLTFFVHFFAVVLHDYNVKLPETSYLRACLHGGGGPQVGEVTRLGGVTRLSI